MIVRDLHSRFSSKEARLKNRHMHLLYNSFVRRSSSNSYDALLLKTFGNTYKILDNFYLVINADILSLCSVYYKMAQSIRLIS